MTEKVIDLLNNPEKVCLLIKKPINTEACDEMLDLAMQEGFDQAIDKYPSTYRNNQRLQLDSEALAQRIFDACQEYFPNTLAFKTKSYQLDSLNSRLRFCKYQEDQWFKIHQDGEYRPKADLCSKLTFLLYLNDASEFEGGATNFYSDQYGTELLASYKPQKGDLLIFSHDIWHSGETVKKGSKYILRSDLIYKKDLSEEAPEHHDGYIWKIHELDERRLVTVSRDKTIKIWDKNLNCLQSLSTHKNSVLDIAHDKNKHLYGVSRDGYISKWCEEKGAYHLYSKVNSGHPTVLSINVFDENCVTTGSDGKIRRFDLEGNLLSESAEICDWHWQLIRYKNMYVSCNTDGYLYFWDENMLTLIKKIPVSKEGLTSLTLHIDALYVGVISGELIQFNLLTDNVTRRWKAHNAAVRDITVRDNKFIYSCGEDNCVKQFSLIDLSSKNKALHDGFVTSILCSNEDIYSVSYDGSIIRSAL